MFLFPLAAGIVSGVFSALLSRGWRARGSPNLLAWSVALAMFTLASLSAAMGLIVGWNALLYRLYYLFGAIVNVPVLALGTLYLFVSSRLGHVAAAAVALACLLAAVSVFTAPLDIAALSTAGIPPGSEVMPSGVRMLSRLYSFAGFFVVLGGALWSSFRLLHGSAQHLRHLAVANALIAAGTFVVAVASGFARYGRGSIFSVGLLAGITLMFVGFLKTRSRRMPE
jgi:hypothetical protein